MTSVIHSSFDLVVVVVMRRRSSSIGRKIVVVPGSGVLGLVIGHRRSW